MRASRGVRVPLKLPRLTQSQAIVDANGMPTVAFQQYIQQFAAAIEKTVNGIQDALDAAGIAQAASATAQAAAAAATSAATTAQSAADANAHEQALINSYIVPDSVLTADSTSITIAAHTRYYADGTSVSVDGATVSATSPGDTDYVSYSDPSRAGGSVSYDVSDISPTQGNDIHVVGAVNIPTSGSISGGRGPLKPGYVEP